MKKNNKKLKAVLTILLIIAIAAGCVFTTLFGLGKQHKGMAKHIDLGLDLAGGVSITYQINEKNPTKTQINDTIYKLEKRVEQYSTESEVYQAGKNRITVEIPGVSDANKILEELGKPGNLLFMTEDGKEIMSGSNIVNAKANTTENNGIKGYVVSLSMDKKGAKLFETATKENIGKRIYIVYDNNIVSAPTVNTEISGGECVIEGMESMDEAKSLASTIRIGALPLTLKEIQSNVVSAKLGANAIQTSLTAAAIGLFIVFLFMTVVYRFPGFLAGIALFGYVILDLLALNGFDATLTLPGIAGLLLAIGMAVDANVIIFTRIKEEISAGRPVLSAIQNGYQKALSAILDGNITTLIAAGILWLKGSGTVKGFAQTLGIGILLSMFTALFITKKLMLACYELGIKDPKFYGKAKPVKVRNYVRASKYCIIASIFVIILGLAFLPINKSKTGNALNYDLEFSGGTSVTMTMPDKITKPLETQVAKTVKDTVKVKTVQTQKVTSSNQLIVKTNELSVSQRKKLESALKEKYKVKDYQTEEITASVSSEMRRDAVIAILVSIIFMLFYIALRFKDIRFGASSILALAHDVLIVFAVYAVARLSVGNTFIACMLTILGYSVNATIVIFDRIRENMKKMKNEKMDLIVNTSISQTLSRSINTSFTSFITIFILLLIGVPSIKEFTFTLICGIICGAYSSICIAGPVWYRMLKK